jgi:hypothetical protein
VNCAEGDGCCPPGCTTITDFDCPPTCGSGFIEPGDSAPQVVIGGPYVAYIGEPLVAFDGSRTVDRDEACGDLVVSYEWDLNGDGNFADASGEWPTVSWPALASLLQTPAQYPANPLTGLPRANIALRATDTHARSAVGRIWLTIYDRQPVAVAHWAPMPIVPIAADGTAVVQLDGSASYHGDPAISLVTWEWQESGASTWLSGVQASLPVALGGTAPATRTLALRVTDSLGKTNTVQFVVQFKTMASSPPAIVFSTGRRGLFIEKGEGFDFNANATSDPDGNWLTTMAWDVNNDGANDILWNRTDTNHDGHVDGSDAGPNLRLVMTWAQMAAYAGMQAVGTHTIKLTVIDSTGVTATDLMPLTILDHGVLADGSATPGNGACNTLFTFDGSASRAVIPGQAISSWDWDFNSDGTYDASGQVVTHSFGACGTQTVTLRVRDAVGHMNTTQLQVLTEAP